MPSLKKLGKISKKSMLLAALIVMVLAGLSYSGFWLYKNDKLGPLSPAKEPSNPEDPLQGAEANKLPDGPQQTENFKPKGTIQVVPEGPDSPAPPEKSKPAFGG